MITLKPITITFEHSEEFSLEDYLEYCQDYDIQPSQKHYRKWTMEQFESELMDDLGVGKFDVSYGEPQEVDYELEEDS